MRASLPSHILAAHDQDYGAFVSLTETALEMDAVFFSAAQHSRVPRQSHVPPSVSHPASLPPSAVALTPMLPPSVGSGTAKTCSNCGCRGHSVPTCFSPGGGMEGQRDIYKKDRGRFVAMFLTSLDDAFNLPDEEPLPRMLDNKFD